MKTIWKFEVKPEMDLLLPPDAEILCVKMQNNIPQMWVLLDPEEATIVRTFVSYGTGDEIKETPLHYIGTFLIEEDTLVFHVFEEGFRYRDGSNKLGEIR